MLAAMVQEHERALGGWQAEWAALPEIVELAGASAAQMRAVLEGLQVDAKRMRANLDAGGGLLLAEAVSLALAEHVGRAEAKSCVAAAVRKAREGGDFRRALLSDPAISTHLDAARIDALLEPDAYLGASSDFIDRALAEYRRSTIA
jgi:3-carboxy-cis,cis-muconate cycloisomerase